MVVQLTISTAILNFDFHRTLAENLETALAGIDAARADGGNTGKRVEEETTTIVTDEEAPEKKERSYSRISKIPRWDPSFRSSSNHVGRALLPVQSATPQTSNYEAVATLSFPSPPVGEKVPEGRMRGYLGK